MTDKITSKFRVRKGVSSAESIQGSSVTRKAVDRADDRVDDYEVDYSGNDVQDEYQDPVFGGIGRLFFFRSD